MKARASVELRIEVAKNRLGPRSYYEEVFLGETYLGCISTRPTTPVVHAHAANGEQTVDYKDGNYDRRWCLNRLRQWLIAEGVRR